MRGASPVGSSIGGEASGVLTSGVWDSGSFSVEASGWAPGAEASSCVWVIEETGSGAEGESVGWFPQAVRNTARQRANNRAVHFFIGFAPFLFKSRAPACPSICPMLMFYK